MLPPVAQLVRAQSLYLWGPWFESKRADLNVTRVRYYLKLFFLPLSLLALFISLYLVWNIFNLPSSEELVTILEDTDGINSW